MTDIVERLRSGFFCREEAADEIERLREALKLTRVDLRLAIEVIKSRKSSEEKS